MHSGGFCWMHIKLFLKLYVSLNLSSPFREKFPLPSMKTAVFYCWNYRPNSCWPVDWNTVQGFVFSDLYFYLLSHGVGGGCSCDRENWWLGVGSPLCPTLRTPCNGGGRSALMLLQPLLPSAEPQCAGCTLTPPPPLHELGLRQAPNCVWEHHPFPVLLSTPPTLHVPICPPAELICGSLRPVCAEQRKLCWITDVPLVTLKGATKGSYHSIMMLTSLPRIYL